jgi:hypothetical protein
MPLKRAANRPFSEIPGKPRGRHKLFSLAPLQKPHRWRGGVRFLPVYQLISSPW